MPRRIDHSPFHEDPETGAMTLSMPAQPLRYGSRMEGLQNDVAGDHRLPLGDRLGALAALATAENLQEVSNPSLAALMRATVQRIVDRGSDADWTSLRYMKAILDLVAERAERAAPGDLQPDIKEALLQVREQALFSLAQLAKMRVNQLASNVRTIWSGVGPTDKRMAGAYASAVDTMSAVFGPGLFPDHAKHHAASQANLARIVSSDIEGRWGINAGTWGVNGLSPGQKKRELAKARHAMSLAEYGVPRRSISVDELSQPAQEKYDRLGGNAQPSASYLWQALGWAASWVGLNGRTPAPHA